MECLETLQQDFSMEGPAGGATAVPRDGAAEMLLSPTCCFRRHGETAQLKSQLRLRPLAEKGGAVI